MTSDARRVSLAIAAGVVLACAGPLSAAPAQAAFTQPTLLSATRQLQFTEANAPAISADGRYVVFEGVVGSVSGVFRRDLSSGEVEPVATSYVRGARLGAPSEALSAPDAAVPSVSADGRYVAFTTASNLGDQPSYQRCPQVYVRDMDKEASLEAYALASALNRSSTGILYEGTTHVPTCPGPTVKPESFPVAGAQAAPGAAISADGRYVVFTTSSPSDLHGAGEPPTNASTPPGQVAVRDLTEAKTTLVTTTPAGVAVPEGGAFPSAYSLTFSIGDSYTASSAAISADGNAVAWLGTDVGEQVPGATGGPEEVEPLWRALGSSSGTSPTRLLADAGLQFEYEPLSSENPVRTGSLLSGGGDFVPPALSADGRTVAVLANVPTLAAEASAVLTGGGVLPSDVYVVRVDESGAPQQVLSVTSTPNYLVAPAAGGSIEGLTVSPDGTHAVFATNRTQFAPAAVVPISPPIPFNGHYETYVANIADGTLERATQTFDGSAPNGGSGLSSFSADDRTLVFSSSATNLLWGDVVAGSEIYASEDVQSSAPAPSSSIGSQPTSPQPQSEWRLDAIALPQRDGSVIVRTTVPGPGRLAVSATSAVSGTNGHSSRRRTRHAKSGRRKAHRAASDPLLARTSTVANAPTQMQVRLRVTTSWRASVDSRIGLYAIVHVVFSAPGHAPLSSEMPVVFHRRPVSRARHR